MLFSRQKKLQRDRDAGLVFCWRGGQGGNSGGLLVALLLTTGLFVAAFLGLSLSFKGAKAEPKQSAKILLLTDIPSEMALWIDQNSPFVSRWDPLDDQAHQLRVDSALTEVFQSVSQPEVSWRKMPELEAQVFTPRLLEEGGSQLGRLPVAPPVNKVAGVYELIVSLDAYGVFEKRLPEQVSDVDIRVPMQEYGSNLRFALTLSPSGDVLYCAPVEWEDSNYAKEIENWVRVQKFKPSRTAQEQVGEVIVKVKVKSHVRN